MAAAYTLTGTFQNLIGASSGYVKIVLAGYAQPPRVPGSGMIISSYVSAVGGSFSVTLWGNDQILPANTRYLISLYNSDGSSSSINVPYKLVGSGSDLSNLTPIGT